LAKQDKGDEIMLTPQFFLDLNDEIIVDQFAGGGGASTGIEMATKRHVDIAVNHDEEALGLHEYNHPQTEHLISDVYEVDPIKATKGRPVGLMWMSPDCKHFSKAKGGKPVDKKIRSLAWVGVKWAHQVRPRVIILENVEEFKTWGPLVAARDPETGRCFKVVGEYTDEDGAVREIIGVAEKGECVPIEKQRLTICKKRMGKTFQRWIYELERSGYKVEYRELKACDYGAPTIRKRLFLIARCDGQPIVWPEPTHADPKVAKELGLKPYRVAAECIDWSIPCPSIFGRKRPLSKNTLRRIAKGIKKFVLDANEPFIVQVNHAGDNFRGQSLKEPMSTVTAKHGYGVVSPILAKVEPFIMTNRSDNTGTKIDEPQNTITAGGYQSLVTPVLTSIANYSTETVNSIEKPLTTVTANPKGGHHALISPVLMAVGYGDPKGTRSSTVEQPLSTIVSGGNHQALVSAFLAKHYSGVVGSDVKKPIGTVTTVDHHSLVTSNLLKLRNNQFGQPVTEPMPTLTAGGGHVGEIRALLVKYYGNEKDGVGLDEPMHTIPTKDRFGLVTVTIGGEQYVITDIGMRMLQPHELYAAQGFPKHYRHDKGKDGKKITKTGQVRMCGNSVSPVMAEALVRANYQPLEQKRKAA
jgi:DNA (cytosine-5)-methyltransferase 1